jgi:fumarylpyruvate hydrolase
MTVTAMTTYVLNPPAVASLPIRGKAERFPINRIFCVGRNYHAHAAEMGKTVDKTKDRPFYFTKSPGALTPSGATIPYPPETKNFHHEMELVVALHQPGFRVAAADAHKLIYGYATGLDMTRRDLQLASREKGLPWDTAKDVENSAVCSEIVPMPGVVLEKGAITMSINGVVKQSSTLDKLIWNVREIIADLSTYYHLQPGDIIYSGTPEGVGAVVAGDKIEGSVEGVGTIALTIGPAE